MDFNGKDELTFHFGTGPIIVRGENLEPLWSPVCWGQLESVLQGAKPAAGRTVWVCELLLADLKPEPDLGVPQFPGNPCAKRGAA